MQALCFKMEFDMRAFLLVIFYLISSNAAAVDIYEWCQVKIENLRELTSYPIENLNAYKGRLAKANSLESLEELTGKDYSQFVPMAQKHQGISRNKAEVETLKVFKKIEINTLSKAIKFQGLSGEQAWSLQFDKCVRDNQ
jgi:hypothetical protein